MKRFRRILYLLTALSHALFAVAVAEAWRRAGLPGPGWVVGVLLAVPLALAIRLRFQRGTGDNPIPWLRLVLLEEPYFAHFSAAVLSMPVFVILLPLALLAGQTAATAALVAYFGTLALCVYGVIVRRRWVRVREIDIAIPKLPRAFDGYRIAQLSDLHIGSHWPRERAELWVRKVRDLDVDLVALTGDYVTNGNSFHADIASICASFQSRDGTVAVMGNHDYFGDGESLVTRLRAAGVHVLRNERMQIERRGSFIDLGGVDDTWTDRADVERTTQGHDFSRPLLVLAHDPRLFEALAKAGASLVLSGHTHWGQIALPFFSTWLNPSRFSYRYHAGLYREGEAVLYVSPGLGTTGPPVRIGAAPEITVLRLRAA